MKTTDCQRVQGLVPGYMDGELSEEQAAPLRRHLLSCPTCRSSAADLAGLSHWFPAHGALEIPADFAARVARAAFAGETETRRPIPPVAASPQQTAAADPGLRTFVLGLTSVAATVLLSLALFMAQEQQPSGPELSAEPIPATLDELDRLNATEAPAELPLGARPMQLAR